MNTEQFVGKTIFVASTEARQSGFEVSIETVGLQTLSNDFRPGRINFKVNNGVVVAAYIG